MPLLPTAKADLGSRCSVQIRRTVFGECLLYRISDSKRWDNFMPEEGRGRGRMHFSQEAELRAQGHFLSSVSFANNLWNITET